ncbi:hypothetical protein [Acuticoccus sp. I52.16.1]|uniref:hypothetical protein n=1 Tax=Acuticoccus sp. I52.16.1 TaxID=2928472 RepID=UPI001FD11809|nr:hypothetical protein [Acuticoccus sp. I52.16.1]UOM34143.1 hypothetical protein MRB58_20305 [Acuticoccus sp. I52.16.1]
MATRHGAAPAMLAAILALPAVTPAAAQSAGRYQLERSGANVLRLDRDTGEIASCRDDGTAWQCKTLVEADPADGTSAEMAAENRRLAERVAVLERRLGRIIAIADGRDDAAATIADAEQPAFDAAKVRRDIDEAAEITVYAVNRFRGLVEALTAEER